MFCQPEASQFSIVRDMRTFITSYSDLEFFNGSSDDRFLNRGILRPGMITPEVVSIFNDHGFNIWGGNWRQPMDYMHFQTPRIIAEKLSSAESFEERKVRTIWNDEQEKWYFSIVDVVTVFQ